MTGLPRENPALALAETGFDQWQADGQASGQCPVRNVLDRLGDKWTTLIVLALSRRGASLPELLLSVAWLHLALTGFRYVALWVVVATPVMARASVEIPYLQEAARRFGRVGERVAVVLDRETHAGCRRLLGPGPQLRDDVIPAPVVGCCRWTTPGPHPDVGRAERHRRLQRGVEVVRSE